MIRRALVTGGARGIGNAIAARLKADGLEVTTPDRNQLDLSQPESIQRFLKLNPHPFDVLVNCAGENFPAPIAETTDERLMQTMQVNFFSAFHLIRAISESMTKRGWGRIVNVSSIYASLARPGRTAYSASKSALDALTRTAALELGPKGVIINSICPGFVDTALTRQNNTPEKISSLAAGTALGRLAAPSEIAALVAFLVSDQNSYMTGQTLIVDGGFSIQ